MVFHTQTILTGLTAQEFFKDPDLVTLVFSHLQVENDKEYRPCLFNAALTCKDFLGPALDALWKNLDSLVPLLKLLPALRLEEEGYILSGNISRVDWDRLMYYSQKVKAFQAISPDTQHPQVVPSTYFRIAQLQTSAFLPSLRHLRFSLESGPLPHTFLFLSPSLESLELYNIGGSENILVRPFLDTLSSQMLNRIILHGGHLSVDILKTIAQFKQLRSLNLSDAVLNNDFVLREVLGTLPFLVDLNLKATGSEPHHASIYKPNHTGVRPQCFDALEKLRVTGSFLLIQDLLTLIGSPCLKLIQISMAIEPRSRRTPRSLNDIDDLITTIHLKWPQSLEDLTFGQYGSDPQPWAISSKSIVSLMELHEIQGFYLKDWRIEDTDGDVRRLVISWPKLTILAFPMDQMPIALPTLRIIAENCPRLRYLQTRLDVFTIPTFNTANATLCHKLEILSAGTRGDGEFYQSSFGPTTDSEMQSHIRAVARHLDAMFPYLEHIQTHPRFNPERWSEIHEVVKLCREVREETRRHMPSTACHL